MKYSVFVFVLFTLFSFTVWQPSYEAAQKMAKAKHQLILLNFSGSDWCGPCMRMRKEIFNDSCFTQMADTSLILINADFPRKKKNQLSAAIQKQNNALAEKYNPEGKFPYTVLINADGKLLKTWNGLPDDDAIKFTAVVKRICNANK